MIEILLVFCLTFPILILTLVLLWLFYPLREYYKLKVDEILEEKKK